MRLTIPILIILATLSTPAFAELTYDQPYLGKTNPQWLEFQRIRKSNAPLPDSLAESVHHADVIFIGDAATLKVTPAKPGTVFPRYAGEVKISEVLKGSLDPKTLPLEWQATATGIEDKPSRHIFFLSKTKDAQWQVDRALFVFPHDIKMRLYGASDIEQDLGLLAIRAFLDEKTEIKGLKDSLSTSYRICSSDDLYSTVTLATELDLKYSSEVLEKVVTSNARLFDIDLYARAVQTLAARAGPAGTKAILDGVPTLKLHEGLGRLPESTAFNALGTSAKEDSIAALRDFIKAHPDYVISAAWALAEIGGKDARTTIESWRKDPTIAAQKEKIVNKGMSGLETLTSDLLDDVLTHMTAK